MMDLLLSEALYREKLRNDVLANLIIAIVRAQEQAPWVNRAIIGAVEDLEADRDARGAQDRRRAAFIKECDEKNGR